VKELFKWATLCGYMCDSGSSSSEAEGSLQPCELQGPSIGRVASHATGEWVHGCNDSAPHFSALDRFMGKGLSWLVKRNRGSLGTPDGPVMIWQFLRG
jgi:hypothetical protein